MEMSSAEAGEENPGPESRQISTHLGRHLHLLSILTPALHPWELSSWVYFKRNRKKSHTPRVMKRCEEPAGPKRLILNTESKKSCLSLPGAIRLARVQDWPLP